MSFLPMANPKTARYRAHRAVDDWAYRHLDEIDAVFFLIDMRHAFGGVRELPEDGKDLFDEL